MSIVKIIYLFCDGAACRDGEARGACDYEGGAFDHAPSAGETAEEQRERARAQGWRHIKGKDYCPDCAPATANAST